MAITSKTHRDRPLDPLDSPEKTVMLRTEDEEDDLDGVDSRAG